MKASREVHVVRGEITEAQVAADAHQHQALADAVLRLAAGPDASVAAGTGARD